MRLVLATTSSKKLESEGISNNEKVIEAATMRNKENQQQWEGERTGNKDKVEMQQKLESERISNNDKVRDAATMRDMQQQSESERCSNNEKVRESATMRKREKQKQCRKWENQLRDWDGDTAVTCVQCSLVLCTHKAVLKSSAMLSHFDNMSYISWFTNWLKLLSSTTLINICYELHNRTKLNTYPETEHNINIIWFIIKCQLGYFKWKIPQYISDII